jgi:triosephosphate isomerase (TIM)
MKKIIIANWKMQLDENESLELIGEYKAKIKPSKQVEVVIAPSFVYLKQLADQLKRSNFLLGAQDVAGQKQGSYTGEVSAEMVKELNCKYVLVGHSERRRSLGETDELVNQKINQCYHADLTPVLCIGETMEQKLENKRETVLVQQLSKALQKVDALPENELLIAYEPVWAIGSGHSMESNDMISVLRIIKRTISTMYSDRFFTEKVRVLYGGSVNAINAAEFLDQDGVAGLLVGTASLKAQDFAEVVNQFE